MPTSPASSRMSLQATRDTRPEMELRRALFARGLRYRVHRRPLANLRREADLVFAGARVAVFVDGCFWHSCPQHGTSPRSNSSFWAEKLERNQIRDVDTTAQLSDSGWTVIRVWEHESPVHAADRIEAAVRQSQSR